MGTAATDRAIARSVAFIATSTESNERVLLLDRFELPIDALVSDPGLDEKVLTSLNLRFLGDVVQPDELTQLLEEQFETAAEFVYGHPIWKRIREGSERDLHAYLMETRHYLAAASTRMSPSIHRSIGLPPLTLLLSRHLLEEWDHARFFEGALKALGCARPLVQACRPMPATLEWIHATRSMAYEDDLGAAICSGFMEHSSVEAVSVIGWHDMLVSTGLLSREANAAIFAHVETDIQFGHAGNWTEAIVRSGPITTTRACKLLNNVATLAEAIYRWLTCLHCGVAADLVSGLQVFTEAGVLQGADEAETIGEVDIYRGLPVWPATLLSHVNESGCGSVSDVICALTYALGAELLRTPEQHHPLARAARDFASRLVGDEEIEHLGHVDGLERVASGWLRTIDGHPLWDAMSGAAGEHLVAGYVLENYHYLASATSHISAGIASSTDATVRGLLINHLEDELEHKDLLSERLRESGYVMDPDAMRPLSTTVAFVGFLQNLGHQDWRAYLLVSTYLQKSLSDMRGTQRHAEFYQAVSGKSPNAGRLLQILREHDDIDEGLGHDDRPRARLTAMLSECDRVPTASVEIAAVGPALAWGFLDGILQHYGQSAGALQQRHGWHM